MIVYHLDPATGQASNLRFASPGYVLGAGEIQLAVADRLPDVGTLHTPVFALSDAQLRATTAIDQAAESARLRYITGGAGQAATYLIKREQTKAFEAAGFTGPVPAMVAARAAATGQTAQAAAQEILATAAAWETKAAQIEQARETSKAQVVAAATVAEINTASYAAIAALAAI